MSGDPERLLGVSSGADALERELLGSVRHVGPPLGAKDEAWRSIAAQLAVGTAVGAAAGSTAAAGSKAFATGIASWGVATKVAIVAVASGLAVGASYLALRGPTASPRGPRPAVMAAPSENNAPSVVSAASPQPVPPSLEPPPAEPPPSRRLEPRRLDSLKAESALLMQARAELRAGNAAAAQSALDRLQAQLPQGMLAQEREVLAIEVLHARGNVEGAKRRAQAFMRAYPKSPHSQKLTRFVE